ncbi:Acg family FMN-binding oxidoreductase [Streptomyces ovatisporus]|uniref:Acg family FMN-binding oxidoreductase n=1 Tax=Streptomyces ovatisporus TaxID=1128682 RepID=A0ABV9A3Q2_9ACTN
MHPTSFADDEVVESLVRDASTAPSMHNAQPWRFRYRRADHSMTLHADFERGTSQADPQLRSLHVACGAALFNLRVAAHHAGFRPVLRLLPDPAAPQTLATVKLIESPNTPDPDVARLHSAIAERRTSRYPYAERTIPSPLVNLLVDQVRAEGSRLTFISGRHLALVLDLIEQAELDADRLGGPDEARRFRTGVTLENASPAGPDAVHGMPAYAPGPERPGHTPPPGFPRGQGESDRGSGDVEHVPHLGLLYTERDDPIDWLTAGQAMERLLLTATREGLASSFATQALERTELRWLLRDPVWGTGPVQTVIRLGYGARGEPTPRRPVEDVLDIVP